MVEQKKEKTKAPAKAKAKVKAKVPLAVKTGGAKHAVDSVAEKSKRKTAVKAPTLHKKVVKKKEVEPVRPAVIPPVAAPENVAPAAAPVAHPSLPKKEVKEHRIARPVKDKKAAGGVAPVEPPRPVVHAPVPPVPSQQAAIPEKKLHEKAHEAPRAVHPAPQPPAPAPAVAAPAKPVKDLELTLPITVKDLAVKLQEKSSIVIKLLMDMKVMAGLNQALDEATAARVCEKFGYRLTHAPTQEEAAIGLHEEPDNPEDLLPRSCIVTLMGHVDHGKTSLLDAIRQSKVTESEHGGITQHIGAYRVSLPHGDITFLDTPGHEAFTAMRARGARITDIVVLVVAADEGIMPQTQEAIDHARAAGVSIIVAVNKIDKPQAELDRVKKQLAEAGLTAEDWGGKTITVGVSAKTGQGIDDLLEMILLEAQMLELKANPTKLAKGVVIEAKQHKYKGPIATLLIQNGTLHLNEHIIVGQLYGKIRAMFDDHMKAVTKAGPSIPIEVMGISGLPEAGEPFYVIADEKMAKELAARRQQKEKEESMKPVKRMGLEDLYSQIKEGKLKELKLIIKADAHGSLEAIKDVLGKIPSTEITLNIIHEGVGNINVSDVILAVASDALILGFNVVADDPSKELIAKEGQEVRTYNIIYELANDIRAALEGMLEPKVKKVFLGRAEVRKVFKLSKSGTIAGCFVVKGKIVRSVTVELVRNGEPVFSGDLASLKRFKDDVREVAEGYECGIALKGFEDLHEGDLIEAYQFEKIARKL